MKPKHCRFFEAYLRPFPTSRLRIPLILASSIAVIVTAGVSHATDCTWNVASGTWNVAGSWTPSVPVTGGTDNAFFSSVAVGGSPVTVTLDGNKIVNSVTFQSSSTTFLTAASNRNLTMAAGLTVQSGAGAVTLSTASNASNGLQISADQVWTNNGTLSITSLVRPSVSTESRTLTITGTGATDITVAGRLRDILSLIKEGSGTLTFGGTPGNYTYTGSLSVKAGTLFIGAINNVNSNGLLGNNATAVTLGATGSSTGTLSYTGATASSNKPFTMATDGTGAFEVTNPGTTLTLSGAIDGSGGLTKTGSGTLVLSNASIAHTGATTVAGGTLRVNGSTDAASGVSITTGTLAGTGTVNGTVNVASGGTIAPGTASTIGTFSTAAVTFASGATFDVDLNATTADRLTVTGDLNLGGATLSAEILTGTPASFTVFTIATYFGTRSGTFNQLSEGATVPINGKDYIIKYADGDLENEITLTAPEVIATPYDDWAAVNITAIDSQADPAPAGDPDHDGASNLQEFAFNGIPLDGADNGQVYMLTADSDYVGDPSSASELILTVAVRTDTPAFAGTPSPTAIQVADGITYTIQGSTTLDSFATVVHVVPTPVTSDLTTVLPPAGFGYEYRSFSLDGSNGLPGKGFLRAKASN